LGLVSTQAPVDDLRVNRNPIISRSGRRLVALTLLVSCVTLGLATTGAEAARPPNAPTLFVLRGAAHGGDAKLTVRTGSVEWFTDRPVRQAGEMTPRRLVQGWKGWGFANDPPNAAITGKDLEVVVELSNPRARGGRVSFDVKRVRGKLPKGTLGRVSAFVDSSNPASPEALTLQASNASTSPTTFFVYYSSPTAGLAPVVLAAVTAYEGDVATFQIDPDATQVMCASGIAEVGAIFQPEQTLAVAPGGAAAVGEQDDECTLESSPATVPAGTVAAQSTDTVPPEGMMVGLGYGGSPVLVADAQPNVVTSFPATPGQLWLASGNGVQTGEAIDPGAIQTSYPISFPPGGRNSATAVLNQLNDWSVTYES
jgi:hypothetical protein